MFMRERDFVTDARLEVSETRDSTCV